MAKRSRQVVNASGKDVGDFICEVLHMIYVKERAQFEALSKPEGLTLEQIASAAIAQGLTETFGFDWK